METTTRSSQQASHSLNNPSKITSMCSWGSTQKPMKIKESIRALIHNKYSETECEPFFILCSSDPNWWTLAQVWDSKKLSISVFIPKQPQLWIELVRSDSKSEEMSHKNRSWSLLLPLHIWFHHNPNHHQIGNTMVFLDSLQICEVCLLRSQLLLVSWFIKFHRNKMRSKEVMIE